MIKDWAEETKDEAQVIKDRELRKLIEQHKKEFEEWWREKNVFDTQRVVDTKIDDYHD